MNTATLLNRIHCPICDAPRLFRLRMAMLACSECGLPYVAAVPAPKPEPKGILGDHFGERCGGGK